MESDQIDVLPSPVLRHFEQVQHAKEAGFAGQFGGDIRKSDPLDRIHLDLAFLHRVSPTDSHVRARPKADAASDFAATHALAQPLRKSHRQEAEV